MLKSHINRKSALLGLGLCLTLGASQAWAETVTTTKTTTYSGIVSDVSPSSRIIVKSEQSEPKTYVITEKTAFVDPAGNVVTATAVRGKPVTVYYTESGPDLVVSKVIVTQPPPPPTTGTVTHERTETYEAR